MPITNVDIQPLFAIPMMRCDLSHAISAEQVEYIKSLDMVVNRRNLISEDLYIFKHKELKSVADAVQEALDIYAQKIMGIDQRLFVTQSWSLMNKPGVGMHGHSHSNSMVSGSLYYTDLPEPISRVFFSRHNSYQQIEMHPAADRHNLYNTPTNIITPKAGELLLFPSNINHMIEDNPSTDERRAIAINSFVRGTIGDYRDVSELTL